MARLSELTDSYYDPMAAEPAALPVERPFANLKKVYITGEPEPELPLTFSEAPDLSRSSPLSNNVDKILNALFRDDEKRLQLWPEKLLRAGATAAGDVAAGKVPLWAIDNETGDVHTSPQMIEKAQEISALAGSGGLANPTKGATLNATPSLRPALKHNEKLYKGKPGQEHQDIIPDTLYNDFQKKAMRGDDLAEYNFGFVNDKGHFLSREDALKYGIDNGLIDPQAGKYGALTSTLMADSSKPGVAIEALAKTNLDNAWWHGSASGDLRGGSSGLHLGTKTAATQALEARIGIPADGKGWTGNREYGKTLLAGQDTLKKMDPKGYNRTGHNVNVPKEDYYPTEIKKYPDGTEMPMTVKPEIAPYKLKGSMSNTPNSPHEDFKANGYMRGQIKKGNPKNGYYYKNQGEDTGSISIVVPNGNHVVRLNADSSKPGTAIEAVAKSAQPFFSAVEHTVNSIPQTKMNGEAWLGTLSNKPGVKPEELQWTGLADFLTENKGKPVTKAQIEEHLAANKVELKEVTKEQAKASIEGNGWTSIEGTKPSETKYHSYQLPGGTNYKEMLLTLPPAKEVWDQNLIYYMRKYPQVTQEIKTLDDVALAQKHNPAFKETSKGLSPEEILATARASEKPEIIPYKSSHWDEPNILAHVRMNDRTVDGKKSLHLEEIQSDWHQQGRDKGYRPEQEKKLAGLVEQREALQKEASTLGASDARYKEIYKELPTIQTKINEIGSSNVGVPDAPFKKSWHELALKRMIREASEKGYDRLSWTPGEAQAARYDLSKQVDNVKIWPDGNGKYYYEVKKGNRDLGLDGGQAVPADKLKDIVGKELTEKALKDIEGGKPANYSGLDLKIGGEGMKGFYDQIIPKALEKLGKEHGVKVKTYGATPEEAAKNLKDFETSLKSKPMTAEQKIEWNKLRDAVGDAKNGKLFYIDIPQSLRDTATQKGFPLFSKGGYMLQPVDYEPEFKK